MLITLGCSSSWFGLRYVIFGEFKGFLPGCQLTDGSCFDLSGQWVSLGLQADLLGILSRRLLLLLGFFPILTSDVRSKTSKLCVLGLDLHLIEFTELVRSVLGLRGNTACAVGCGVLTSDLELLRLMQLVRLIN